ncbi:MAG: hypothetical protein A2X58_08590 [Nitrospirae bacterium GWC2_56_14]|nr:MAG: hypothetical protein A2X58_08590 [Nitrospirae bacterium GWC2_56_14]
MELLKGLAIPAGAGIPQLIAIVGDRLPLALAVVLIEEGSNLRDRFGLRTVAGPDGTQIPEWYQNPEVMLEIANEIEAGIDADTIMRVVDDFLSCNPVSSILERLMGVLQTAGQIRAMTSMQSTSSSPASPEETSPDETKSCGDSPLETASPTSESTIATSSTVNQSSASAGDSA